MSEDGGMAPLLPAPPPPARDSLLRTNTYERVWYVTIKRSLSIQCAHLHMSTAFAFKCLLDTGTHPDPRSIPTGLPKGVFHPPNIAAACAVPRQVYVGMWMNTELTPICHSWSLHVCRNLSTKSAFQTEQAAFLWISHGRVDTSEYF